MKRLTAALLVTLLVLGAPSAAAETAVPRTAATSTILVDAASGRVLYEHNAHERRMIASITKLMTALVAVESAPDLDAIIEIQPEYTKTEGSSMYLEAGEKISLEGLLYGLLMASGNDAALAIAGGCAGTVGTFVSWMNAKAADLGMEDTHFANPNGLNDGENYSTAADMEKLARTVIEHPLLMRIVGTKSIHIAGRSLTNHNKLLWQYEGCIGMKTGYTDKAGRTLVSCAERAGQRLIAVTLNDPDDWRDHAALFDYGFATYPKHVLALAGREFCTLPLDGSLTRFLPVRTEHEVCYPLTAKERVRIEVVLPRRVRAPVAEGEVAGKLVFHLDNMPIGQTYLVCARSAADDSAAQKGLLSRIRALLSGTSGQTLAGFWLELGQAETGLCPHT